MGDLINLRHRRKIKARAAKEKRARENRDKFGQSKIERERAKAQNELNAKNLDGARRDQHLSESDEFK